jgi:hypothetical protein
MEILWLKSHGLPHALIAQLADMSEYLLCSDFELFVVGGVEKLKEVHIYRPASKLVVHATSLEEYFRLNPPATIKEAQSESARDSLRTFRFQTFKKPQFPTV